MKELQEKPNELIDSIHLSNSRDQIGNNGLK